MKSSLQPQLRRFRAKRGKDVLKATPAGTVTRPPSCCVDEAESMVPNIDPEQVRKLAGWGLTQNDIASFVGWSQSLISLGF